MPEASLFQMKTGDRFDGSGVCLFTTIQDPVGQTDACKNITFARFATRAVKIGTIPDNDYTAVESPMEG